MNRVQRYTTKKSSKNNRMTFRLTLKDAKDPGSPTSQKTEKRNSMSEVGNMKKISACVNGT